jgi:cysteinyl-tRNA synthetase
MGHARVLVMFDVITRHLRRHFPQVEYVRNITDIDDKIIQRAVENKEDIYALTNRFIAAMHEDEQEPGRPSPQGDCQLGSLGFAIFHSTKSSGSCLLVSILTLARDLTLLYYELALSQSA